MNCPIPDEQDVRVEITKIWQALADSRTHTAIYGLAQETVGLRNQLASPLLCDECGEELQQEACRHVRACLPCRTKALAAMKLLLDDLADMIEGSGHDFGKDNDETIARAHDFLREPCPKP